MDDFQANEMVPLYRQLYEHICGRIDSGEYRSGDRIPSELELCKMCNVSRVTVRSAIQRLVDDGVLVKMHGKGTFVAMPAFIESTDAKGSFTESCLKMNAVPSTKLISRKIILPGKDVSERLNIRRDQRVICIKRLRLVDGLAVIFEVDYFQMDYEFLLQEDLENVSLLNLLYTRTGVVPKKFDDYFDIGYANKEQAAFLDCDMGTPLLRVLQTVKSEQMHAMYFNEQLIRSDRYKYTVCSY
jgi:GntR family transcriptional regulator